MVNCTGSVCRNNKQYVIAFILLMEYFLIVSGMRKVIRGIKIDTAMKKHF